MRLRSVQFFVGLGLLFEGILSPPLHAQETFKWQSYTSLRNVHDVMVDATGGYWGATDGGAFRVTPSTGKYDVYRNVNALSAVSVRSIAVDPSSGTVVFGGLQGQLDFLMRSGAWRHSLEIVPEQLRTINKLLFQDSVLYIAADYGISTFDLQRFAFITTSKHLGPIASGTRARSLAIWRDTLYVGTDQGVVYASVHNSNLADSAFWSSIPGIQNRPILAICASQTMLYVATNNGLQAWDGTTLTRIGGPAGDTGSAIVAVVASGNNVYAASRYTVFQITGLTSTYVPWASPGNITSLAIDSATSAVVVGDNTAGIIVGQGSSVQTYVPNSPVGNIFTSLSFDKRGVLWTASAVNNFIGTGLERFDGKQWMNFSTTSSPVSLPGYQGNCVHSINADSSGNIWAGTFGDGLLQLHEESGAYTVSHYNISNSPFSGVVTDSNFCLVDGSLTDPHGVQWFVPYLNLTGQTHPHVVAYNPHATSGNGFYSFTNPLTDYRSNYDIAIDNAGTKWISPIGIQRLNQLGPVGVMFFNEGPSLDNTSDDLWGVVGTDCGLRTNEATTVALDQDGELWIGTSQGISILTNPEAAITSACSELHFRTPYLSALNGSNAYITCILVDALNNKWIGTLSSGLFVVTPDGKDQLAHFDHTNSPILDDEIYALAYNKKTGDVYIGTRFGLSVVSGTGLVQSVAPTLKVGPQPYIVPSITPLYIYGVPPDAEVHIFTVSGALVRSYAPGDLNVLGGTGGWDGKDSRGNWAASGIYLIAFAQPDGTSQVAKFVVVRR